MQTDGQNLHLTYDGGQHRHPETLQVDNKTASLASKRLDDNKGKPYASFLVCHARVFFNKMHNFGAWLKGKMHPCIARLQVPANLLSQLVGQCSVDTLSSLAWRVTHPPGTLTISTVTSG